MSNKFSEEELLKVAETGLADLTCEQIKEMIKKESAKDYEDINTEFIDLCFNVLEIKQAKKYTSSSNISIKSKKVTVRKVLLFAAVFMIFIATTLTVSAQLNLNIPQKIAQLINGDAEIDYNLENADTTADGYALLDTDLAKRLENYGITPVTFPEELIKENAKIIKIDNITTEKTISTDVKIEFNYNKSYGNLCISQYADDYEWTGEMVCCDVLSGEMIKVNGMDILIFEREDSCSIYYKDNLTVYDMYLETDINSARLFAKSIK